MAQSLRTLAGGVAAIMLALPIAAIPTAAGAQTPIGPDQHFTGLVNGRHNTPNVYTVCPGPSWPGRTGPVASSNTLSVAKAASGAGYTGPFSQIYAWVVPKTATAPPMVKFTTYGQPQSFPSTVRVPCDGKGTVEFSSCPYLAPCAAGWIPDYVKVRFVNIAV